MFNIRVYGILINDEHQVLVSDELIRGKKITKFCGGGLEKGEGTIDCLKREFMEEMNLPIEVSSHFYTTDFYQQSAFNEQHQIISIYYLIKALSPLNTPIKRKPFDFDASQMENHSSTGETQSFRLIEWADFDEHIFTLPIDKTVAHLLKNSQQPTETFSFEILENERVRLEPIEEKHYAALLPIALHTDIWKFTIATVNNEMDFRNYFDEALNERAKGITCAFAVYDKLKKQYAGSTRFGSISKEHKRMEIGWTWYAPSLQGTGVNKACKFLLLQYAFEQLEVNRIELKTSLLNSRSQKAMEKLGAYKEGIFRRHIVNTDGTIRDSVYYSFIKEDWENIKATYFL